MGSTAARTAIGAGSDASFESHDNFILLFTGSPVLTFLLAIGCFALGYTQGRRSRDGVIRCALRSAQQAEQQSGAFAVLMPLLEKQLLRAHEQAREADPENRRALNAELREQIRLLRARWADLRVLRNHANRVVNRALDDLMWHSDEECPFGKSIYVATDDGIWHCNVNCGGEYYDTVLHQRIPCPQCASELSIPWVPDERTGVSLKTALENFLEESHQLDFESEESEEAGD